MSTETETVTPVLPPLPQYFDSSMLAALGSCPRKYLYQYLHNLRTPGVNIHLIAGGAFAAAIDAARRSCFEGSNYDDVILHAYHAFAHAWGSAPLNHGEAKSYVNTFDAVELYLKQYWPLTDEVKPLRKKDGTIASEFTFSIPFPIAHPSGEPYIFTGRFDMLGYHSDQLVIVDEKTTGSLGASWVNQWKLRGQFMGYIWACQQLGYNVNTVLVRGIGLLKTQTNFLQAIEQFPQYMIDRWYAETIEKLKMLNWMYTHNEWRFNFGDACTSYGGCTFATLCTAHNPAEWFSNYSVEVWDPLHKH